MIDEVSFEEVDNGRGWRNAIRLFFEQKKTFGDILTKEWIYDAFEIELPNGDMKFKKATRLITQCLDEMKKFQYALLHDHQIDLQNQQKVDLKQKEIGSFLVVPPKDQTRYAERDGIRDIQKSVKKWIDRVTNVDHSLLTDQERRENDDGMAKAAKLRGMIRKELK